MASNTVASTSRSEVPKTEILIPADDSELGEDFDVDTGSLRTDLTSLCSSVTKFREENGRRYHSYGSIEHWGPNDERAQQQQDLSHHLWTMALQHKLYLAPIEKPRNVLDLGTGTGIWALDLADEHPDAQVRGIDLSPIQPTWVPENVAFEVDDYNVRWTDVDEYDLIHARELLGTSSNWPEVYSNVFRALKPGGWFDQCEPGITLLSDHNTLDKDHVYNKWGPLIEKAGKQAGLDFNTAPRIKGWLEEAGFVNVTEVRVPLPIGKWPKDPHQRNIGIYNQVRLEQGIMDFCSRRFANQLGWKPDELEIFGQQMRTAIKDSKLLAHHFVYFVYGQKPEEN